MLRIHLSSQWCIVLMHQAEYCTLKKKYGFFNGPEHYMPLHGLVTLGKLLHFSELSSRICKIEMMIVHTGTSLSHDDYIPRCVETT